MILHFNIRVTGLVQGVNYRAYTREKCEELGIEGFVRNEPDGSVYIEAEGNDDQLQALVSWCKEGAPRARVEKVNVEPGVVKNYKGFSVKR